MRPSPEFLIKKACAFYVGDFNQSSRVKIERRNHVADTWAITDGLMILNKAGEWEYEPMPSSRDDEFLERCRFTLEEAIKMVGWE